ncbi:hypothetical protein BDV23DRAFT_179616 [Aspergillus alliaceus]|uniref:Uncharacterized protein n=1 Tax=Petromyces alliaceus TaxID=209559 RepID=A0A5N6FZF6_PETAA|nr:uncharacterized protein BDW43DRAFT_310540 [Aspergillus alliaceus]KAB8234184.1 hypothetical protein BDW43DRAFT_310540 [Aspergillus alliaceus]KAE8394464.1 hypothetical protein BDV23DRAFT_179616 [Aspergillus alliaceus]
MKTFAPLLPLLSIAAPVLSSVLSPADVLSEDVIVQLANDWTGANANATISPDGSKHSIQDLWGKSDLVGDDGEVYATSASLVKFEQGTACRIVQKPNVNIIMHSQMTWVFLDRGAWVKLDNAILQCVDVNQTPYRGDL